MLANWVEIYIFLCGLCIGSFLNVCIYRIPVSESIAFPRSRCPYCRNLIRFYDNIPVLSYLFLLGRCRFCRVRIALRYPFVEIITGLAAVGSYLRFGGLNVESIVAFAFIAALIVVIFIDIDHQIIPDIISLPGIPILFACSFFLNGITVKESALGILVGGGILYLIAWGYHLVTRREGMGGGDIKLLAMIGAYIGWRGVVFTIYVSSITGMIAGLATMLAQRQKNMKMAIPFGPFLSLGAITYLFFGDLLIDWYYRMLGG